MSDPKRRDFLTYATIGTGAAVAGAAAWPLLRATGVTADVRADQPGMQVDVSTLQPGTQVTVMFGGQPVFIRRRTGQEIQEARATPLSSLPDQHARNAMQPASDASDQHRTVAPYQGEDTGEWLVIIGICTHLGCIPLGDGAGDFGGWYCPCHGAHFDSSGRVRSGPAPTNMAVPHAEFKDATTLILTDLGQFAFS